MLGRHFTIVFANLLQRFYALQSRSQLSTIFADFIYWGSLLGYIVGVHWWLRDDLLRTKTSVLKLIEA